MDNAAAWAMSLVPIAAWLIHLPVRYTFDFAPLTYFVSLVITLWVSSVVFYLMDRTAIRQAGVDARAWDAFWMLGPFVHLIQRTRYTGQPWAMPVIWVAGLLVALAV